MKRTILGGLALLAATTFAQAEEPKEETVKGTVVGMSSWSTNSRHDLIENWRGYHAVLAIGKNEKTRFDCIHRYSWGAMKEHLYTDFDSVNYTIGREIAFLDASKNTSEFVTAIGTRRDEYGCLFVDKLLFGNIPAEDPKQAGKLPPAENPKQ